ncbi:MAG: GerMN domain-containing protein [Spirochaetales bacterium]|nr:GerMN domain-containing protein [Spirochaetales bacterium]
MPAENANKLLLVLLALLVGFVFMDMQARNRKAPASTPAVDLEKHIAPVPLVKVRPVNLDRGVPPQIVQGALLKDAQEKPPAVTLYYIRFKPGQIKTYETELVRLERELGEKPGPDLMGIIEMLRQGPLPTERGLISAFDERTQVLSARKEGSCALLEVDSTLGRLGNHVIRDRLDQIVFTLTELEGIDCVRFYADGVPLTRLGQGYDISATLSRSSREVHTYRK